MGLMNQMRIIKTKTESDTRIIGETLTVWNSERKKKAGDSGCSRSIWQGAQNVSELITDEHFQLVCLIALEVEPFFSRFFLYMMHLKHKASPWFR